MILLHGEKEMVRTEEYKEEGGEGDWERYYSRTYPGTLVKGEGEAEKYEEVGREDEEDVVCTLMLCRVRLRREGVRTEEYGEVGEGEYNMTSLYLDAHVGREEKGEVL